MSAGDSSTLDNDQAETIRTYLELRDAPADDRKAQRQRGKLETHLDEIYWKRVETILRGRVRPDRDDLPFSEEERLLIDMGLLDLSLVRDAGPDLPQRLLDELQQPGAATHFYLTEWFADRHRRFRLTEGVTAMEAPEKEITDDGRPASIRRRTLTKLAPLFQGLPGVTKQMADLVVRGGLDTQILQVGLALLDHPERRLFLHRRRLCSLRSQVVERARARAQDQATLRLFDLVDESYAREWRESFESRQHGRPGQPLEPEQTTEQLRAVARDAAQDYLVSELRLVKSLVALGALAGGVTRTCAVLLNDSPRLTKNDVGEGLALAETCDRHFDVRPNVLIAPFRGRGIFEWDRDSIVIGLQPVESAEDSVANATGNRLMLIDSLHHDGRLRRQYEETFPGGNFQQRFQADYRTWVLGPGRGTAQAMEPERLRFFREHIGPDCSGVLAPASLRNLGPQTREAVRARLLKQIAITSDANLHHRLAVLYWMDDRTDEALQHMAQAARLAPRQGLILLGLGLLLRQRGQIEQAKTTLRLCAERAANSIWCICARDLLAEGESAPEPLAERPPD